MNRRHLGVRLVVVLLAVLGLLVVFAAYLLSPQQIPEHSSFELDLPELRRLAALHPGSRPLRVNVAIVAESTMPAAGVLGGVRFDETVFVWTPFQVVAPDGFLVIDAPPDEEFHGEGRPSDPFFAQQHGAVQRALREADWILVTHEHPDHIGGIAQLLQAAGVGRIADRLLLTTDQLANPGAMRPLALPRDLMDAIEPLDYEQHHPLGPGVVLVRAPGHTRGSQLVYVALESGVELLLVGDVAWHRAQFEEPRGRPRISSWLMGEDHDAVAGQLRALHELDEGSNVRIVVSHDPQQINAYVAEGILGSEFDRR